MAYYVRSDAPSGRYIRTDVPDGRYLAHSAKGTEWSKGHKYVDKRWIQGAWHYLYPEMLEAAKRAGDAVKDTAKKATDTVKKASDTVKETAKNVKASAEKKVEETKKAAKDFKNYSKEVDSKLDRYQEDKDQRWDRKMKNSEAYVKESEYAEKQGKEVDRLSDERAEVEKIYGKNSEQYKYAKEREDEALNDLKTSEKRLKDLNEAWEKNNKEFSKDVDAQKKLEEEKKTDKYKASKALNDVIDGATGATKQAAQWLKNQLNSGADWTTDQIEKIRESDAVASLAGKLENLYANTNSGATKKGLSILSQIIGWGKLEAPKKSSNNSSGRTYSGTGTKAQRREAVGGGPVSNNDYRNRPKKRR